MIDTAMMRRLMTCCGMENRVIDDAAMRLAKAIWAEATNYEREACANLCDIEATNCMEVDADAMPFLAMASAIRKRSNVKVQARTEAHESGPE